MSLNLDSWVLPAEASRVDRVTLRVWRFWEYWLRGTLALARRVAFGAAVLALIAWFIFEGSAYGISGVAVAGAVVIAVAGGMRAAGSREAQLAPRSTGQMVVAVLVGLPLAFLVVGFATVGLLLVLSLVVVPVMNHPILIVVVVPTAFVVGRLIRRLRRRNDARYPRPAIP